MASCAGDWVEVRSKEEILATLDENGRLDGMPFMPEMLEFCGKRMRVQARAHKSCDTINPISSRALPDSVVLANARCSGAAHGGCQAACAIFWKESWLKPAEARGQPAPAAAGCGEAQLQAATIAEIDSKGKIRYQCQTTDFPKYTTMLRRRDIGQYVEDVTSKNVKISAVLPNAAYFLFAFLAKPQWGPKGARWRKLYDRLHKLWGGIPYPRHYGVLEDSSVAPMETLDLKPGEMVRVRPYDEILATLDTKNMNKGLFFDGEMVPYCGGVFRVRSRVETFLDERTGYMRRMKTPAVILENVWCRSHFSDRRIFCPRAIYSWWREGWLERAPEETAVSITGALGEKHILKSLPLEEPC